MKLFKLRDSNHTNPKFNGCAWALVVLALGCFAISPLAQAVVPAPGGGYPGQNTAEGKDALFNLDTSVGSNNTAIGFDALYNNTTGFANTAIGLDALRSNTTSDNNTAIGLNALQSNTCGPDNTATGANALQNNTTGSKNTAIGFNALSSNTTGGFNVAVGRFAGANLTTGNANIDIGNAGVADEAKTIRIGETATQTNAYIAGISGMTVPEGVGVLVDSNGHLGTVTSSKRFKEEITPMNRTSEAIFSLEPVTFRYKKEIDPAGTSQFGLIAEEVAKVILRWCCLIKKENHTLCATTR
jgi:hypothetical protein